MIDLDAFDANLRFFEARINVRACTYKFLLVNFGKSAVN